MPPAYPNKAKARMKMKTSRVKKQGPPYGSSVATPKGLPPKKRKKRPKPIGGPKGGITKRNRGY